MTQSREDGSPAVARLRLAGRRAALARGVVLSCPRAGLSPSSGMLLALLDDILVLTGQDGGEGLPAGPESFDPASPAADVAGVLAMCGPPGGAALTVQPDSALPHAVSGDARRLRRLVLNLAEAARVLAGGDLADSGGRVVVSMETQSPDSPGDDVGLVVEVAGFAPGPGPAPEVAPGEVALVLNLAHDLAMALGGGLELATGRFRAVVPVRRLSGCPPAAGGDEDPLDGQVIAQLAEDVGADELPDLMDHFIQEMLARVDRIATGGGISAGTDALAREAHTLKSTAGTFGARHLMVVARDLEHACRSGPAEAVPLLAARLPRLAAEAVDAYRRRGLLGPDTVSAGPAAL
jgi:HPt (histidine-containing phosphotransfer) domain-containing protein